MNLVRHFNNSHHFENYRDLLLVLLKKEMKVRYTNKMLGYLWSVASPLAFAFVYYIAFQVVMQVPIPNYPLFLLSGLLPWQWFSNSVDSAPQLFLNNAPIIKKVNFPRDIISMAVVLNHMTHFFLSLPVIVVFLLVFQKLPSVHWVYGIPLLMVVQAAMVHGITLILATFNLFLRDIERLVSILLNLVFYFTPILYSVELIPTQYRHLIFFNPVAPLMVNWRNMLMDGTLDWGYLVVSLGYSLLFLGLGYVVYRKLSWRFAEVV